MVTDLLFGGKQFVRKDGTKGETVGGGANNKDKNREELEALVNKRVTSPSNMKRTHSSGNFNIDSQASFGPNQSAVSTSGGGGVEGGGEEEQEEDTRTHAHTLTQDISRGARLR